MPHTADAAAAAFDSEWLDKMVNKLKAELEAQLAPGLLVKFKRLLVMRQGRAVVGVDGGACGGCRTRLRTPVVAHLREAETLFCESCQRILYDPSKL